MIPVLLLALLAVPPEDLSSSLRLDRTEVRLSDSIRITLTIEGSAPLVVTVPTRFLDDRSEEIWQVRPVGSPVVEKLGTGREKWTHHYLAKPFLPGKQILEFAPFEATAGGMRRDVHWGQRSVEIRTEVPAANPEEIRPVTGIEEIPQPTIREEFQFLPMFLVGVLVLFASAVTVAALRRRRRPARLTPSEQFERELANLAEPTLPPEEFADRLGQSVRTFAEQFSGIAARKRTTSELSAEMEKLATFPAEALTRFRTILDRCDRAKFAAAVPDLSERSDLLQESRQLLVNLPAHPGDR